MKRTLIFMLLFFVCMSGNAQEKNTKTKTSEAIISIPGYCCKGLNATIERTLAYERGVIDWQLDQPHKTVKVTYKEGKTNADKIEKALAENGVRTANYRPNSRAIEKLPPCCQPSARGEATCKQM